MKKSILLLLFIILFVHINLFESSSDISEIFITDQTYYKENIDDPNSTGCSVTAIIKLDLDSEMGAPASLVPFNANIVLVSSIVYVYEQSLAYYKLVGNLKTKGSSTTTFDGLNEQGDTGYQTIVGSVSFNCVDTPTDLEIIVTNKSLPIIRRNPFDQPYLFEIAISIPTLEYKMELSFVLDDTNSPFSITEQQQISKSVYILKFSLANPASIKNSNEQDPQIEIVPQIRQINGDFFNYTSFFINPLVAEANGTEQFSNIIFYPIDEGLGSKENYAYVTFDVIDDGINEFGKIVPGLTNNLEQLETSLRIATSFAYAIKGNKTHTVFLGAIETIKETQFDWYIESSNTLNGSTFNPLVHTTTWIYDTSLVPVEISGVCTFAPFSWTATDILPTEYSFSTMNSKKFQNYIEYWCVTSFVSTTTELKFGHSILLLNGFVSILDLESTVDSFYGSPYSSKTINYGQINYNGYVYPAPVVADMVLIKITPTTSSSFYYGGYTIRFLITSETTFYYMEINEEVTVTMANIISGSTSDGLYEIHVDNNFIRKISLSPFTITVCNVLFNCKTTTYTPAELKVLDVNGPFPNLVLPTTFEERTIYNITNLYFEHSELNTTGNSALENIIYLGTIDGVEDDGVYLILNYKDSILMNGKFQFTFNNTLGFFTCKFPVAANLYDGVFDYSIQYYSNVYSYSSLFSVIGDNSTFLVNSVQADMFPPLVNSITVFPAATDRLVLDKESLSNIFGWDVTIDEGVNGFSYGEFNITSDYDKLGYQFKFNSSHLGGVNGNMLSIRIDLNSFGPIKNCYTQQYSITSVYLLDKQGYQTSKSISALFKTTSFQDISIIVDCSDSNDLLVSDVDPPYLSSFLLDPDYSNVVYSEGKDTIKLSFTITDDHSGLSNRHHPTVYFEDISGNLLAISINNGLQLNESNGFSSTYLCNTKIPFGWTDVSISIYGIVDNYSNIRGYGPLDLKSVVNNIPGLTDFNPFISVQLGSTPFISNILPTFDPTFSTAQFVIQGVFFGSNISDIDVTVKYISDDGVVDSSSPSSSEINIPTPAAIMRELFTIVESDATFEITSLYGNEVVINVDFTNPASQNLQIQLLIGGLPTNTFNYKLPSDVVEVTLSPNPTPTATTISTSGISTTTTSSSSSPNDLSTPLEGVSITIDPNSPTGQLNQVELQLTSIINIHQIREVQTLNNNTVLHQFDLRGKWVPATSPIANQFMYSNQLSNSQGSIVYVTLNVFDHSSTFEFGGKTYPIVKNSIKYTVNITNYKMESPLNNLQLIMQAQLNSSQTDDICSKKVTSKLGDSDVLSVQLNDKSLYCRFLKTAIIDGTLVINNLTHVNLNSEFSALVQPNSGQYYYGIVLPSFEKYILLDPDFSLLLQSSTIDSNSDGGVCSSNGGSKLSTGAIVGIVLGGVALIVVGIIVSTSLIFKKYRFSNFTMKVRKWSSNRRSSKSFNLKNF